MATTANAASLQGDAAGYAVRGATCFLGSSPSGNSEIRMVGLASTGLIGSATRVDVDALLFFLSL